MFVSFIISSSTMDRRRHSSSSCLLLFLISLFPLVCDGLFDGLFKGGGAAASSSAATSSRLLAALPRPRFGGPVLASAADPATRDFVGRSIEELEALGAASGDEGLKGLDGGWILRWAASRDIEKLAAQPKSFVLGAVYQSIVKTPPTASAAGLVQVRKAMIVEKLGPEKVNRTYQTTLLRQCALEDGPSGLSVTFFDKKCCVLRDPTSGAVDILERSALPGARVSTAELQELSS